MALVAVCDDCGTQSEALNKLSWYQDENADYTNEYGLVKIDICNACFEVVTDFLLRKIGWKK